MGLRFTKLLRNKRASRVSRVSRGARKAWEWGTDEVLTQWVQRLVIKCKFDHVKPGRVFCCKSTGATTRAYARIWGLGRIWQQTLDIEPSYIIEVISEKFDRLTKDQQDMVLIHELLHIPKTFSGALVPHKHKGGVNDRVVRQIFENIKK